MTTKEVSAFEYAITQIADPEKAKTMHPIIDEKVAKIRREKLESFLYRVKVSKAHAEKYGKAFIK